MANALSSTLVEEASGLEPLRAEWDALAVLAGAPFSTPAWVEAWWRHLAPERARLAVVAIHDGAELIGLAPFYATRRLGVTELRLLSGGLASRLEILAKPGREHEAAEEISSTLAALADPPGIIHWESVDAASKWPEWISAGWPSGREHRLVEESTRSAPVVLLGQGSYDEWLAGKSRNFRSQMRRHRRSIEEKGGRFRTSDRSSLSSDLEAFSRLHSARWEERGGSRAVNAGVMAMLEEVGADLIDSGRLRIWLIEGTGEEVVSAQVFLAAGGNLAYWNGGFDEGWSEHSPGIVAILAALGDAIERGDKMLDLGGGEARYKERMADEDRPVAWRTSYPRGARYPLARLRRLPEQAARRGSRTLRERIGSDRLNRLRGLFSR